MDRFDFWRDAKNEKPKWMKDVSYLAVTGSRAYGTAVGDGTHDGDSDWDFSGFCVPPAEVTFPFLGGDIPFFWNQKNNFKQLQLQHLPSETYGLTDITVYSVVYYFDRVLDGNPNMIDTLYVPDDAVLIMDDVGKMVRDNKHLFVSQKMFSKFMGMAKHHLHKIRNRQREGSRKLLVERFGYDVKDASHVVRCLLEVGDYMLYGEADLSKNAKTISDIRAGEWKLEEVENFHETTSEYLYGIKESGEFIVPEEPRVEEVRELLVNCLEEKYGSLTRLGWNTYGRR